MQAMPENDFDEELTDEQKEELRFAEEKREGFYQPPADAAESAETQRRGGMAIGAVYALVALLITFIGAGYFLDRFFDTSPWFIVIGVILGTVMGFYQFIRISSGKA